VKDKA